LPENLERIDLRHLGETVDKVFRLLGGILDGFDYYLDFKSEMEADLPSDLRDDSGYC